MFDSREKLQKLLEKELMLIEDVDLLAMVRRHQIEPRCEMRAWDYGDPGTSYPCWIVLEDRDSNVGTAYCEHGFGPKSPWGLLFLSGKFMSMGMDCEWFSSLSEAVQDGFMP